MSRIFTTPSRLNKLLIVTAARTRSPQNNQTLVSYNIRKTMTTMQAPIYSDETPADIKNAKGLHLITTSTPNGKKLQIMFEELKEAYGIEYTHSLVDLTKTEHKKDWFLRLNPNGRIPVVIDNTVSPPFCVIETSAQLLYLLKKYDPKDVFGFIDEYERSECLQWLFFWHGSGAPIEGQLNWFGRLAGQEDPYAIMRFKNEVLRVFGVLEIHLSGKFTGQPREYLAGPGMGKYSVADIGTWPWVSGWDFSGRIEESDLKPFPHLMAWVARVAARPAVQNGTAKRWQNW